MRYLVRRVTTSKNITQEIEMKYQKKPVVIEATQWFKMGDHPSVFYTVTFHKPECKHCGKALTNHGWVPTLEGDHIVCPGDWIITGVKGEVYPCKPDIFEMTYSEVGE
jgi:hypothetical protein